MLKKKGFNVVLISIDALKASMPKINMQKPVKSFKAFQGYFNNNYGLRDMLIMPNSSIF
jgi:hypothetical protein